MRYLSVAEAKRHDGLCLTLTAGAPGPWSEAAKGVLHVKKLAYAPVLQKASEDNRELIDWCGSRSAPTLVCDSAPPQHTPEGIILTAERLAPEPELVPRDAAQRARMFGLLRELTGYTGLGWCRRLQIIAKVAPVNAPETPLTREYRHGMEDPEKIAERIVEILKLFGAVLAERRACGEPYLLGSQLSALDIYWATFAVLIEPLDAKRCPGLTEGLRAFYTCDAAIRAHCDDALIEHRDRIYREYLQLPMDF